MGKRIKSKKHYEEEMKRGNYISQDKARAIADEKRKKGHKAYAPSEKARHIINSCNPDRKGRVKLSDRQIDALKSMGVSFDGKKKDQMLKEQNLKGRS